MTRDVFSFLDYFGFFRPKNIQPFYGLPRKAIPDLDFRLGCPKRTKTDQNRSGTHRLVFAFIFLLQKGCRIYVFMLSINCLLFATSPECGIAFRLHSFFSFQDSFFKFFTAHWPPKKSRTVWNGCPILDARFRSSYFFPRNMFPPSKIQSAKKIQFRSTISLIPSRIVNNLLFSINTRR